MRYQQLSDRSFNIWIGYRSKESEVADKVLGGPNCWRKNWRSSQHQWTEREYAGRSDTCAHMTDVSTSAAGTSESEQNESPTWRRLSKSNWIGQTKTQKFLGSVRSVRSSGSMMSNVARVLRYLLLVPGQLFTGPVSLGQVVNGWIGRVAWKKSRRSS